MRLAGPNESVYMTQENAQSSGPYPEFFSLALRDGIHIPTHLLQEIGNELVLLRVHAAIVNQAMNDISEPSPIQRLLPLGAFS